MIPKHFDQIDKTDIDDLVANAVREGRTIEYKEQQPGGKDEDKKEFLADVSSFANASGGDLLFGVTEQRDTNGKATGIPDAVVGLSGINADHELRRLENMIRDGIEPRIPGVQLRAIEGFANGPVILTRIPRSWAAPHMVTFKASPRFFSRTSAGKAPLDVAEIRASFVQSEALPERIRRFREERLGKILAGETPMPVLPNARMVMHVVPVSPLATGETFDVLALLNGQHFLPLLNSSGGSGRLNLDGYVIVSQIGDDELCRGYSQFFRNASIETVDATTLRPHKDLGSFIPSVAYEKGCIGALGGYLALFRTLHVPPPYVVMLSFLGVKGYYMYVSPRWSMYEIHKIDRDTMLIPEVVVEDDAADAATVLRPAFDLVWQACGLRRSCNYDEKGNWNPDR